MDTPDDAPDADDPTGASSPRPATDPAESVVERLSFSGDGREYFQIWIVNVALTIVTLGIYSPWAKVRRLQYFYRNTHLARASFDYHGDPIAIFKGRLVGAFLFLTYTFAGIIHPFAAVITAVAIAVAMPWLLSRSLRFRLHNSSYRGLRFRFSGSTRSAYWVFLGLPILTVLSLLTLGPFWHQRLKRYQFNNASYGQVPFVCGAPVGDFYVTYVIAALIAFGVFGGLAAMAAVAAGAAAVAARMAGGEDASVGFGSEYVLAGVAVAFAIYFTGVLTVQAFTTARIRNLVWNHTTLGGRRFMSDVRTRSLLWLLFTNLAGMIVTLGLFWPFAQVRLVRYLAGTFSTEGPGSFNEFAAASSPEEQAVGEEVAEFFDFDIAF